MRTKSYSTIRTMSSWLLAAWVSSLLAMTCAGATFTTTNGSTVSGEIQFTTSGSVFVKVDAVSVERLKRSDLSPESEAAVAAWEGSNPANAGLSTKFDNQPQPVKMKSPERTPDISSASGVVMLAVVVDEKGRVASALVRESSDPRFNSPSVEAMNGWEFAPLTKNAQPTRGLMFVPIQY
jgi:TonB family protein